jgi:hypothetical protein
MRSSLRSRSVFPTRSWAADAGRERFVHEALTRPRGSKAGPLTRRCRSEGQILAAEALPIAGARKRRSGARRRRRWAAADDATHPASGAERRAPDGTSDTARHAAPSASGGSGEALRRDSPTYGPSPSDTRSGRPADGRTRSSNVRPGLRRKRFTHAPRMSARKQIRPWPSRRCRLRRPASAVPIESHLAARTAMQRRST